MEAMISLDQFVALSELMRPHPGFDFPKNALDFLGDKLKKSIKQLLSSLEVEDRPRVLGNVHKQAFLEGAVYVAETAIVEATAFIQGPAYIGPGAEIRHAAYIRGNVYVGRDCIVGHTTEVKGSVFLDGAKAGHFAYVGDSILGRHVNLGAGTKLANLKLKGDEVSFQDPVSGEKIRSGLRKFGALLGDHAQTGCNSVLSPGTLLLPHTAILPCVHFCGTLKKGFARGK